MMLQVGFFYALLRFSTPRRRRAAPTSIVRSLTVVVPAYNERRTIGKCLQALASGATVDPQHLDVVVVDAGCTDATMAIVAELSPQLPFAVRSIASTGGRGPALNAGIRAAKGDAVLVLHADTLLPAGWDAAAIDALAQPGVLMTAFRFGCDRSSLLRPDAPPAGLALMEWTVNLRSAWFDLPFGDQALALSSATLAAVGGYPDFPMLEEYELVCRLRKRAASGAGRIVTLALTARCSPRRFEQLSIWRTNIINQLVMLWYRFGATPEQVCACRERASRAPRSPQPYSSRYLPQPYSSRHLPQPYSSRYLPRPPGRPSPWRETRETRRCPRLHVAAQVFEFYYGKPPLHA